MAGIGFELKKILKEDRILSLAQVYGYSAILSSGPWVVSIIAILLVGFINIANYGESHDVFRFQVVITYAIALASSLIITGILQLPLTRYVADLIFNHREDEVLPSYFGALFASWLLGLPFIIPFFIWMFNGQSTTFIIGAIGTFLVLSGVWISSILASSLKYYNSVVWAYFVTYSGIVFISVYAGDNIEKLIYIFFVGNTFLFVTLMTFIIKSYRSTIFFKVDFFMAKNFYWTLAISGFAYNLGTWIDKIIFWYHPSTGFAVMGKLHASLVYDMPIFLAYLSIIPGMAIFFYRLEADFAEKYDLYYNAVRNGGTLSMIKTYKNDMTNVIHHAIHEIILVQGIVDILLFLTAPYFFNLMNIPHHYLGLLYILTIGAMLQLAFMSILAILYYLDRKVLAMWLSISFLVLNTVLTLVSIEIGPRMYGFGYTVSLLLVFTASMVFTRKQLDRLDYETFMLQ